MKKVDISKHVYVAKHIKLGEKEANELLTKYNISIRQLAKISRKDVAIKELDVKAGDIIKIVRDSPTIGKSVYYRTVVDG